ncbi:MAG: hypothetical protein OEX12_00190 [Gammaproteobacteria bacterium]|nr:hypothetical protein [Gammaproteobacteria bacterium]
MKNQEVLKKIPEAILWYLKTMLVNMLMLLCGIFLVYEIQLLILYPILIAQAFMYAAFFAAIMTAGQYIAASVYEWVSRCKYDREHGIINGKCQAAV